MKFPKSKLTLVLLLAMTLSACGESACGGAFTGPFAVIVQELFPLLGAGPVTPASMSDLSPFTIWVAEANSATAMSKIAVDIGANTITIAPVNVLSGVHAGGITSFLKDASMSSKGLYLWHDNMVEFLDASTAAQIGTITISATGVVQDFAISPDGKFGYATVKNDTRLYAVDLITRKVAWMLSLGTGANPRASAVDLFGNRIYVTDAANSSFYVVDGVSQTFTTKILPGVKSELGKPAVRPDGLDVWIPNVTQNLVYRYSIAADYLMNGTIDGFLDPREIAFTNDGQFAWVLSSPSAGFGPSSLSQVDTGGKVQIQNTYPLGNQASGLALSPLSSVSFVANSSDGTITETTSDGKTASLKVGSKPVGVVASR